MNNSHLLQNTISPENPLFQILVKSDNTGTSTPTQFTIPTNDNYTYNYTVQWFEKNNASNNGYINVNQSDNVTIEFGSVGEYVIRIRGEFPYIYFNNGGDKEKLLEIQNWGDIVWESMESSFYGCSNLNITASDTPDLSSVTSLFQTFRNTDLSIFTNANSWDVSSVTNMTYMFFGASSFNQDISSWDVSNVTDMSGMFDGASSFNNGEIGNTGSNPLTWTTTSLTSLDNMFSGAIAFNQDVSSFNVSGVTNLEYVFEDARKFNNGESAGNSTNPLGWTTGVLTNTRHMFVRCYDFNQDITGLDTSGATDMSYMFYFASSFDQDISHLDFSSTTNLSTFLAGVTLSTANYDKLLIQLEATCQNNNVSFNGGNSTYTLGSQVETARTALINDHNWTLTDEGVDQTDQFQMLVQSDNTGTSTDTQFTIPTGSGSFNYDIEWFDYNDPSISGSLTSQTGDATIDFPSIGTYCIRITGDFPHIEFNNSGDKDKLLEIQNWGDIVWGSMHHSFWGCADLSITASDTPDLSNVTTFALIFATTPNFVGNGNLSSWDVSNVTNFQQAFNGAESFNDNISGWSVSSATDMSNMFRNATSFNQDLSNWNVSNVTNMTSMFNRASSFNQDLSSWDVSSVTTMDRMFAGALSFNNGEIGNTGSNPLTWTTTSLTDMIYMFNNANSFNQDLSSFDISGLSELNRIFQGADNYNNGNTQLNWDVSHIEEMFYLFGITSFDQDLSSWDFSSVTNMHLFLHATSMSTTNYDKLLIQLEATCQNNDLSFSGGNSTYTLGSTADEARQKLIDDHGWTITDGGADQTDQFQMLVKSDNAGTSTDTQFTIPTNNTTYAYNYNVEWFDYNDPSISGSLTSQTGDATIEFPSIGTYCVRITGDFPHIYFNNGGDKDKLLEVQNWGDIVWSSFQNAFHGCSNLNVTANDTPDLSSLSDTLLNSVFRSCTSFTGTDTPIGEWDMSSVTQISFMFLAASSFNGDIGGWDTSNITRMQETFRFATSFDQNLGSWDITELSIVASFMNGAGLSTSNYDQTLIGWESQNITKTLSVDFGTSTYTSGGAGETARQALINNHNWEIIDGGGI